jgi:hypothetical protein
MYVTRSIGSYIVAAPARLRASCEVREPLASRHTFDKYWQTGGIFARLRNPEHRAERHRTSMWKDLISNLAPANLKFGTRKGSQIRPIFQMIFKTRLRRSADDVSLASRRV